MYIHGDELCSHWNMWMEGSKELHAPSLVFITVADPEGFQGLTPF